MQIPDSPLAAATHPDPYAWYAQLRVEQPIFFDAEIGIWVVAGASEIEAVLNDPNCRVRPTAEPVPVPLEGSLAGDVFSRLVRMNDGEAHAVARRAISPALAALAPSDLSARSDRWARLLAADPAWRNDPSAFAYALPVHVLGDLLGIAATDLTATAHAVAAFVAALGPAASADQIAAGSLAVEYLRGLLLPHLHSNDVTNLLGGLNARWQVAVELPGSDSVLANAIGFLFQSYDATAGLIGNTLLALAAMPAPHRADCRDNEAVAAIVSEVALHDPPIQNTRRFVPADAVVAGQSMRAGDIILVLLASANRDPEFNPRSMSFGAGPHTCPGQHLALAIATAGVVALLAAGLDVTKLPVEVRYRPSVNARVPQFGNVGAAS